MYLWKHELEFYLDLQKMITHDSHKSIIVLLNNRLYSKFNKFQLEMFNIWQEKHIKDDKMEPICGHFFSYIAESNSFKKFKQLGNSHDLVSCMLY